MQENKDKHLETLIGKVIKKASLESPSEDFTDKVMSQVLAEDKKTVISYKPIISKPTWLIIGLSITALVVYILLLDQPNNAGWLNNYDFNFFSNNVFSKTLAEISYSSTTIYAVLTLTLLICAQLVLLKNYFNKQLEA